MHSLVRTRVTVAVIVFVLFNLVLSTVARAKEKANEIPATTTSRHAEENGLEAPAIQVDTNSKNSKSLKAYVKSQMASIQHSLGNQWIVNKSSLECASEEMRGAKAGACIIKANLFSNKDNEAMFAILVGEEDENGGMVVRKVEFLKQNN